MRLKTLHALFVMATETIHPAVAIAASHAATRTRLERVGRMAMTPSAT
jgi:hypothetical protein